MRLPKVGSQYLIGFVDADKNYFDGGKTYKVALPPNIPPRPSGRSRSTTTRRGRCCKHRNASSCRKPELLARCRSGRGRLDDDLFRSDEA